MSISATIIGVSRRTGEIDPKRFGKYVIQRGQDRIALGYDNRGDGPGQAALYVVNPPERFEDWDGWVGEILWGGSDCIMHGEQKFAVRLGYTSIELVDGALQQPKLQQP